MSRSRKLLIVGVVLVVGVGLAWPFRKTAIDRAAQHTPTSPHSARREIVVAEEARPRRQSPPFGLPTPHVVAKMAGMSESLRSGGQQNPAATFDLANHPALAASSVERQEASSPSASPVTPPVPPRVDAPEKHYQPAQVQQYPSDSRPAYATSERSRAVHARQRTERKARHVVESSDTLEKLAKRYLGDEGRALEIFDLNRDLLDNPHLLPIGAKLRIPVDQSRLVN